MGQINACSAPSCPEQLTLRGILTDIPVNPRSRPRRPVHRSADPARRRDPDRQLSLFDWRPRRTSRQLALVPRALAPTPPCATCPVRTDCRTICTPLERLLAAEHLPREVDEHRYAVKDPGRVEFIASRRAVDALEREPDDDPAVERKPWAALVAEAHPLLEQAIDRVLTPRQQETVRAFLSGARPVDIARERRCSKPTVTILLRRARRRIGQHMTEHGLAVG